MCALESHNLHLRIFALSGIARRTRALSSLVPGNAVLARYLRAPGLLEDYLAICNLDCLIEETLE